MRTQGFAQGDGRDMGGVRMTHVDSESAGPAELRRLPQPLWWLSSLFVLIGTVVLVFPLPFWLRSILWVALAGIALYSFWLIWRAQQVARDHG